MSEEIIVSKVPATRWRNPTNDTISFELNVEGVRRDAFGNLHARVVRNIALKPGVEVVLPSEFDKAIHGTSKDGYIVSGLAPQLRRVLDGEPVAPRVHPALMGLPVTVPSRHVDSRARESALRARRGT